MERHQHAVVWNLSASPVLIRFPQFNLVFKYKTLIANILDIKWKLFFQNAFVGCHYSSAPSLKMDTENTTACRVPFHDRMPSSMNFRRVLDLLEFKNQASQCFVGNQRCPGVWNSFPFLAWDLSMHPRTHIWFFNQFICTGEYACSSNLNYAHKMPRKHS